MPNRILKESVKRCDQIDQLSWFEEVVFYRLILTADDYGCIDGRSVLLKNELFPTRDNVTKKSVEDAISKLASVGLLCKYTVNGKPYLFFPTWEKHQRLRSKHRKYPEPPAEVIEQINGNVSVMCQSYDGHASEDCQLELESNPNPNPNPESESKTARPAQSSEPDLSAFGPELQKAITEWLAYKKEKGNTYKPTGLTRLLTQIKNYAEHYGEAEIVKLIETCEARNYQGIIFDLLDKKKSSGSAQRFSENYDHDEEGGGFF